MSQTTILDIAKALNLSPSTVSRALRGNGRVNASTRKLVEKKASEMEFRPNQWASSLRTGTSNNVGIIVPDIANRHYGSIVDGAERALSTAGYNTIVAQSHNCQADEQRIITHLTGQGLAGIILCSSTAKQENQYLSPNKATSVMKVQIGGTIDYFSNLHIDFDYLDGAFKAVKHLIIKGYNRIGLLLHAELYHHRSLLIEGSVAALLHSHMEGPTVFEDGATTPKELFDSGCDAFLCTHQTHNDILRRLIHQYKAISSRPIGIVTMGRCGEHENIGILELPSMEAGNRAAVELLERIKSRSMLPSHIILPILMTNNSAQNINTINY